MARDNSGTGDRRTNRYPSTTDRDRDAAERCRTAADRWRAAAYLTFWPAAPSTRREHATFRSDRRQLRAAGWVFVIGLVIVLASVPLIIAGALALVCTGLRAGDRPGDVTVTAVLSGAGQSDPCRPVILVTVRNPGHSPVLVGCSARRTRLPDWLDPGLSVTVPRRTTRARYRAERQAMLGVVGAQAVAKWAVPVPEPARRYELTAVAGQPGRRLRVIRLPVGSSPSTAHAAGPLGTLLERDG